MNAEKTTEDYCMPSQGDEDYEIPSTVMNAYYQATKKQDNVPASSYNVNKTENSKIEDPAMTKKCGIRLIYFMILLIGIALLIAAGLDLFPFLQISQLRSDVALLKSTSPGMETTLADNFTKLGTSVQALVESIIGKQFSEPIDRFSADVTSLEFDAAANLTSLNNEVNNRLKNISDSLSIPLSFINQVILKNTGNANSQEAIFVDILNKTGHAFSSCAVIRQFSPSSPSGNYHVRSANGSAVHVYCDMTRSCGDITGGWMRVAELDMTDTTTQCPSSLGIVPSPRRSCRAKNNNVPTCSSVKFTVDGVRYSKVCGRVKAYQLGTPDAFGNSNSFANSGRETNNTNIETYYVDGVSLTHGTSPRQHIWTFAAAIDVNDQNPNSKCSCTNTAISSMVPSPPSFVGEDYFCDTGASNGRALVLYIYTPLWDGAGCGRQNTCCSFNKPPWFYKQLPQSTTDDIEMRVCRDQPRSDENILIQIVEIYVQ